MFLLSLVQSADWGVKEHSEHLLEAYERWLFRLASSQTYLFILEVKSYKTSTVVHWSATQVAIGGKRDQFNVSD